MAMAVALSSLYPIDLVFLKCHLATYKHTDVPSAKFQDDKTLCLRDINLHIPGKASGCLKKQLELEHHVCFMELCFIPKKLQLHCYT